MRVLVLGASGFIGRHVVRGLLEGGHSVSALVRDGSALPRRDRLAVVTGDLLHRELPPALFTPWDAVVHCAGTVPADPDDHCTAFVRATEEALGIASRSGARRFVHLSSLAVSEPAARGEALNGDRPFAARPAPWNHYARSRIAAERRVRDAHEHGAVPAVILRPGVVFGPGDRTASPRILRALASRHAFRIGDGRNPVASLAVEDLAEAVVAAALRPGIAGRCHALAARRVTTQNDLFDCHARPAGLAVPRRSLLPGTALAVAAVMERLARLRGARPRITRFDVWVIGTASRVDDSAARRDLGVSCDRSCADAVARFMEDARSAAARGSVRRPEPAVEGRAS